MIDRLVVFGGTGDLTGRYLLPGLAALQARGHVPERFEFVGAAREDWDEERFRDWAAGWLERQGATTTLAGSLRYQRIDLADPATVAACFAGEGPVAVYLALPPAVFPIAVTALHRAGLPSDSHGAHIDEIEVIWDESLALEGRAGYYDHVGALKDMLQNHLLQLLCLVAMEPPISLGERDLRDRKVDVLRSVRPLDDDDVATRTRRARYRAGRVGDRDIPAYVDELGVTPEHGTETFAEVILELDSWRWSGTRFRLRTGKALGRDRKEVVVHFRPVPHHPFDPSHGPDANRLRFGLEPEGLSLELTGTGPGVASSLVPLTLSAEMEPPELPAYGRILHDVLGGNSALSIRGDEAEEAWRVVTPVLEGWSRDVVPLEEYDAGVSSP